jgi:hypothetical protein
VYETSARIFERLCGVRRPPTGPLTTEETAAQLLRQETPVKDDEQTERKQEGRR